MFAALVIIFAIVVLWLSVLAMILVGMDSWKNGCKSEAGFCWLMAAIIGSLAWLTYPLA